MADETIDWARLEETLGQGNAKSKFDYWKRLTGLEIEDALKESNFSHDEIQEVLALDSNGSERINVSDLDLLSSSSGKKCCLLAVLGRDHRSFVKSFNFSKRGSGRFSVEDVIALCVNLSSNTMVDTVSLHEQEVFGTWYGCTLLGNALKTNSALRKLDLFQISMGSGEAVKSLVDGLKDNKALRLETLDITLNKFGDEGVAHLAEMLQTNTTLKDLQMYAVGSTVDGAKLMSSALAHNTTLRKFAFGGNDIGRHGMKMILSVLTPTDGIDGSTEIRGQKLQGNRKLKFLELANTKKEQFSIQAMASVIKRNKTLSTLNLRTCDLFPEEWIELVTALKKNNTLKSLDLRGCSGLDNSVFDALIKLLQSGYSGLEEIDVARTALSMQVGPLNEELRINKEYRTKLSGQTLLVQPKSGRLVMCGYEFAGKTTLCKTMVRVGQGISFCEPWKITWKNFVEKFPRARVFLFGERVLREFKHRTRGFDIVTISDAPSQRIFAWDFAGQKEYYALHDYMFPNIRNSCFLYVCNPARDRHQQSNVDPTPLVDLHKRMREQFIFWLKFISSNSKAGQGSVGVGRLPIVHFVLTNKDKLKPGSVNIHIQWAIGVVSELKKTFENKIDLSETVQIVNAQSQQDVAPLLDVVKKSVKEMLFQPSEYSACRVVRQILESWAKDNGGSKPILRLRDFEHMIARKVAPEILDALLAYLNDVGEIIFLKSLNFIVVNPRWFGVGVLGYLVNAFRGVEMPGGEWNGVGSEWKGVLGCFSNQETQGGLLHQNGFVERQQLDYLLQTSLQSMDLTASVSTPELIKLIIHLEMAFEESEGSRLFVPAVFDDPKELAAKGERKLEWTREEQFRFGAIYLGLRLQCEDDELTFLGPGFFPRLQVVLRNYFHNDKMWTRNSGFRVDRNLIGFMEDDMEVLVEYSGSTDYFVDILVRSFQPFAKTSQFIREHVVSSILTFCASPRGCQGVQLVEAVIRPVCVEELHLCAQRKYHSVKIVELRRRIEQCGKDSKHTWEKPIPGIEGSNVAVVLLDGQRAYEEFQSWEMFTANQLEDQQKQVTDPMALNLPIDKSLQSLEDFPKLFYATIKDVSTITRLSTKGNQILARVLPVNLHLLCDDGKGNKHKVQDQPGRLMKLNSSADNNLPLMKLAVSILWMGLKVGASSVGVFTVPPPEIERWIDSLFEVPKMNISSDRLVQYLSPRHSTVRQEASEELILNALNKYLKLDPSTQWLKGFLNLQDYPKFQKDFKLFKVKYREGSSNSPPFGWLCERCYFAGLEKGILQESD